MANGRFGAQEAKGAIVNLGFGKIVGRGVTDIEQNAGIEGRNIGKVSFFAGARGGGNASFRYGRIGRWPGRVGWVDGRFRQCCRRTLLYFRLDALHVVLHAGAENNQKQYETGEFYHGEHFLQKYEAKFKRY